MNWTFNPPTIDGLTTSLVVILLFTALVIYYSKRRDPREPPYIYSRIPFIGHAIGMMLHGAKYYEIINRTHSYPIYTLPMLWSSRVYVVSDATLAGQIQRERKTMSFYSLIVEVTRRLIAFDARATEITFRDMNAGAGGGPGGLMEAVHDMMNRHLGPGKGLQDVVGIQMDSMGKMLSEIPDEVEVDLYAWQRHIFSMCNMRAIYGPLNIFAVQPDSEAAFWRFEHGMLGLVVDIMPWITARKAYKARRRVLDGLVEFVKTGRYKEASPLIRERVDTNLAFGMSEEMAGHAELILMFGILGNAVPSNFWLIVHIFSRPELLQQIREEVETALSVPQDFPQRQPRTINIPAKNISLKTCPLLYACYRETLRDISLLTSARLVLEDTIVGDRYFLKKDAAVQIAGGVLQKDRSIWGADAHEFRPQRFLDPSSNTANALPPGVSSSAFRAFGGGTVICPGRHFAQSELMVFAAVLALGFDVRDPDGAALSMPDKDDERIPLSVMKPVKDPRVLIKRRKGWEVVSFDLVGT